MKIACIGWGSLIWDPRDLKVKGIWHEDGPLLPIEFNRISRDKRVTLIIDKKSKPVVVLWSLMEKGCLKEAIKSLQEREGCFKEDIHSAELTKLNDNPNDKVRSKIIDWLRLKKLDAAIWTGLPYKNTIDKNKRMSLEEVMGHLKSLSCDKKKLAKEYIEKAPEQIKTEYRKSILYF